MKFLLSILISALGLTLGINGLAQNQTNTTSDFQGWYQVELIVFTRNNPSLQEHFPTNIQLYYPSIFQTLKDPNAPALAPVNSSDVSFSDASTPIAPTEMPTIDFNSQAFYLLPADMRSLNFHAKKFTNSSEYQLLFHQAWRQIIRDKNQAEWILIDNHRTQANAPLLSGTIRLSVANYLRAETRLWLAEFEPKIDDTPSPWPEIPENPELIQQTESQSVDMLTAETESDRQADAESNSTLSEPAFRTKRIILLKEKAEMRSNEVNYIDHPIVGVIIKITPFTPAIPTIEPVATNPAQ
jgi:hypothetical protein